MSVKWHHLLISVQIIQKQFNIKAVHQAQTGAAAGPCLSWIENIFVLVPVLFEMKVKTSTRAAQYAAVRGSSCDLM